MPGKIGFRVAPPWPRPSEAQLAAFVDAGSAQVADSMSRMGAMDAGLRPVWNSPRIVGAALTVWCHSGDNLMLHKALTLSQPGDIVVLNTQGNVQSSPFGELLASSAVKFGIRGVIVDGTVRDVEALEAMKLPVYSRGIAPGGCNKDGGGEVGTTIACGGVAVRAGDILLADRDGITVVPLADAEEAAKLAGEKVASERKRQIEIEQGILVRQEINEVLRRFAVIS